MAAHNRLLCLLTGGKIRTNNTAQKGLECGDIGQNFGRNVLFAAWP